MNKPSEVRKNAYAEFSKHFERLTAAVSQDDKETELKALQAAIRSLETVEMAVHESKGGLSN